MKDWKKWADRLLTLAFGISVLAVVWVLVQVTSFTLFHVPSPSMYPTFSTRSCQIINFVSGPAKLRRKTYCLVAIRCKKFRRKT